MLIVREQHGVDGPDLLDARGRILGLGEPQHKTRYAAGSHTSRAGRLG
jgi:hypothetical protein